MNIEKLTKRLSVHNKELKIPTKHMPAILDIIEYMKTQTKKREKKWYAINATIKQGFNMRVLTGVQQIVL